MDKQLLTALLILIVLLTILAVGCLFYVITSPKHLAKRRRKGVTIIDGADVIDGRITQDTAGLKHLGEKKGTVVVGDNLWIRNRTYVVRLRGRNSKKEFVIPIKQYAILGRYYESGDSNFYAVTDSPYASRNHCIISAADGQVYVNDYNSFNHTYVNNVMITENTPLNSGDVLTIGGAESFDVSVSQNDKQ